jgi:hypothetical protein
VFGLLVKIQQPEGNILVTGALDPAGKDEGHAVGVKQHKQHHPGIAPPLPLEYLTYVDSSLMRASDTTQN